ncbi:hypothetical protein LINPERHAP2_LOCUS18872 [Linum perenne]
MGNSSPMVKGGDDILPVPISAPDVTLQLRVFLMSYVSVP